MQHIFTSAIFLKYARHGALLLATAGAAQAQTPAATFAAAATLSTGAGSSSPRGIAVADVNGDGRPDLLTANRQAVGVLLGTGMGTFGAVTTYNAEASSYPSSIAVADVNGDGRPDVLTANGGNTAGVMLGTGTGAFGAMTVYSSGTGSSPNGIAVADVNGDGRLDLLIANTGSSTAGVLLGTGTGTFGAVRTYSAGASSFPNGLAVADVNGDGRPDLLTANTNTSTAGVLLGTGTGNFGAAAIYSTGTDSRPAGIAVADVNGDGRPDLLTANYFTSTAGVLLGTGAGAFGAVTAFGTGAGSFPNAIAVADVNGDRQLDIITANYANNTAGVLLGAGTGSFGAASTFSTGAGNSPYAIAVADVNGDGRLDIVTVNNNSNTVGVLLNTGTYTPLATARPTAAEITLSPNPARDAFTVQLPAGLAPTQAELLNALGQVVRRVAVNAGSFKVATSGLAPGVYTLRLRAGGTALARRVVVE